MRKNGSTPNDIGMESSKTVPENGISKTKNIMNVSKGFSLLRDDEIDNKTRKRYCIDVGLFSTSGRFFTPSMYQKEITAFLARIGLSEKEVAVYLEGLQHGPMHATALAKACALTRPNVYDVLKRLGEKGLCSQLGALYGRKFKMSAPSEVQVKLNRERKLLEQLESELVLLTPALDALRGKEYAEYPKVEYFEGREGLRALFDATLRGEKRTISATASIADVIDLLGDDYAKQYVKCRVEKSIKSRTLRFQKGEIIDPFYSKPQRGLEIRYAPPGLVIRAVMLIWDDKVSIIPSRTEHLGIIIHSKGFAETMQSWFDFFWKTAKLSKIMTRKKYLN